MVIKEKFSLVKNIPNVLNLSSSVIKKHSTEGEVTNLVRSVGILEKHVNHFTKKRVFNLITDLNVARQNISVVDLSDYPLHVSYSPRVKKIIINVNAFGVDDVYRIDAKNLYACLVYGIVFSDLVSGKVKMSSRYYTPIVNYLNTIFMRVFGKTYGLLGNYSTEIPKLKFLISCYVLAAFFGEIGTSAYKKATILAGFNYKDIEDDLKKYDFSEILQLIKALSELKVLPGFDKYAFTHKIYQHLKINFLAAVEDLSRFMAVITTSNIPGSNVVPTFLHKYNTSEYQALLKFSEAIFRRS